MKKMICTLIAITCLFLVWTVAHASEGNYKCNLHPDTPLRVYMDPSYASNNASTHTVYYDAVYICDSCSGSRVVARDFSVAEITEGHNLDDSYPGVDYSPYNSTHHTKSTYVMTYCTKDCGYEVHNGTHEQEEHYSTSTPMEFCGGGYHTFRKICRACGTDYIHYRASCDGVNHPVAPLSLPNLLI